MTFIQPRGLMKETFEAVMNIPADRATLDERGSYANEETYKLWRAFKLGMHHTPGRGQYVVARLNHLGLPEFDAIPDVLDYRDQAKTQVRAKAQATGETYVVYKQVVVFDPHKYDKVPEKR